MEELQLTLTPSRVDQRNFGVMLSNWRVGQVLSALVIDRMPNGNVLLNVGGREFITPLDLPVQAGSRLQLEVHNMQPQITLKVLGTSRDIPVSQLTQLSSQNLLFSGSGSNVDTKPTTLTSLFGALSTQPALRSLVAQSPAISAAITALVAQSLSADSLSPSALASAIGRSGLFNEANLVSGRINPVGKSSKTQLAQLQKAISSLPAVNLNAEARASLNNLSDLTNAALANLTQQQLISMPQDGGGQRWCFGIPVSHDGAFVDLQMLVERDAHGSDVSQAETIWRVDLSLSLPEIGPIRVLVTMRGREVSVVFNSDSSQVRALVDSSFGQLKERMIFNDFRVTSITAQAMTEVPEVKKDASQVLGGFEVRA